MSARLALAEIWLPKGTVIKELLRVEGASNRALDSVLTERVPTYRTPLLEPIEGGPEGIRVRMAKGHRARVDILLKELGREEGTRLGRRAVFEAGEELGRDARARLRVGGGARDIERAAKLLYRVLGIDISISISGDKGEMRVTRCSLSSHYSKDTCSVLSAMDAGMFRGLSPRIRMHFSQSITSGSKECLAAIEMGEGT